MSHATQLALLEATWQTLYMVFVSGAISVLLGLPIGVLLSATQGQGLLENKKLNRVLSFIVNVLRSVPFIILMIAIIPLTRFLVGSSIGTTAAIVPLSVGAIPFVARLVENILAEIPKGLIESGLAMGATPLQIITRVLLPEALPPIINGITVTLITLVSYSAMAGTIGGGGLGNLAINYGYQRFDINVMLATIFILIVLVQLIQFLGDKIAQKINHA